MKNVGTYEVKTHLSQLLDQVESGQVFQITRHGTPIARLVPIEDRDQAQTQEAIHSLKRFRQGMPKASIDEITAAKHEDHRY